MTMSIKLMMSILFIFLLVGTVSAFDFDNVKSYDAVEKEITVKNFFSLGDTLATYKLTENTDQCLINCHAEGNATLYTDGYLFTKLDFKNVEGSTADVKNYKVFIEKVETYEEEVNDYKEICSLDVKNVSETCTSEISGTHTEERERIYWEEYKGEILKVGNYRWRIEAQKNPKDSVDWIASSFGEEFSEWAWWDGSWLKKKQLTANSVYNLNDYQIRLNVTYESSMKSDFSDLRFLYPNETSEMNYWIEKYVASASAIVWVKADFSTANGTWGYMYYGNAGASSTSSGNQTMDYFEDFSSGVCNGWTTRAGSWSCTNGYIEDGSADARATYPATAFNDTQNRRWRMDAVYPSASFQFSPTLIAEDTVTYTNGIWIRMHGDAQPYKLYSDGTIVIDSFGTQSNNNWLHYEYTKYGSNYSMDVNNSQYFSSALNSSSQSFNYISLFTGYSKAGYKVDNITISKYADPEPVVTFGGEQEDTGLSVQLSTPADSYSSTTYNVTFNCSSEDDVGVTSIKLIIDNVVNYTVTNSTAGENLSIYQEVTNIPDGSHNWTCNATDGVEAEQTTTARSFTIDTTPFIEFLTPPTYVNYFNTTNEYVPMAINTTTVYFQNITYLIQNVNGTTYTQYYENETYNINFTNLPDAHYHYNVTICTSTGKCNSTETRHLNHDTIPPIIYPATNLTNLTTFSLPVNSSWSYLVDDDAIDTCYYHTSDSATNVTVTCNATIETAWLTGGTKTVTYCANDTFGNQNCSTGQITIISVTYATTESKDPVGEGQTVVYTFQANISGTSLPVVNATFIANNTQYTPLSTVYSDHYDFTYTLNIPEGWGNSTGNLINWYWNYSIAGFVNQTSTPTDNTTIYSVSIDNCTTYGDAILNISLRDEELTTLIYPPTVNDTNVQIDLEISSLVNSSQTWEYSNTWLDDPDGLMSVCVPTGLLTDSEYRLDFTIGYSAGNYVQKFFYLDNGTLDSTKQFTTLTNSTIDLYDLLLDDSTTFIFEFTDEDNLEVPDGIVHLFRRYIGDGEFREVERGKQDDNGETHLHVVEEDVIYYFVVSLQGQVIYTSSNYNAKCQSTPCTISLSALEGTTDFQSDFDNLPEGTYSVTVNESSRSVTLSFNLNETGTMNLTIYELNGNSSESDIIVNSSSLVASSGSFTISVPEVYGNITYYALVEFNGDYVSSKFVDLTPSARTIFPNGFGVFLAMCIIITLGLAGATQGIWSVIMLVIGFVLTSLLTLLDMDYTALIFLVCLCGIIIYKLVTKKRLS